MYKIELTVTPKDKKGLLGKPCKELCVKGFATVEEAKAHLELVTKNACKLNPCSTNVYFAEMSILCNDEYCDMDNAVIKYHPRTDKIEFVEFC